MPQLLGPNGGPVRLYDRRCTLDVGREDNNFVQTQNAVRISGLRVTFKIIKTDKTEPNHSEIQIFNLTEDHRSLVELEGTRCRLSAGYAGSESQIFSGDVKKARSQKQDVDWVTHLELGDGWANFATARVTQFFGSGTNLVDVVKKLALELVKDPGNLLDQVSQLGVQFSNGYSVSGSAAQELTRVLEPYNLGWSIQDGRIEALGPTEFLPGEGPRISADSGLIGSPGIATAHKKGPRPVIVKCLLHPALRPGSGFQLDSKDLKGEYRCTKVEHTGDTHGQEWTTELEALPRRS